MINLRKGTGIYPIYARLDILEGLAATDHPATQIVIAETLRDLEGLVAKRAESILRRPAIRIYPPTIQFLLEEPDEKRKYQEFAFALIENNQSVGITDSEGRVLPTLDHALLTMPDSFRSAVIASKLTAPLSTDLYVKSANILRSYLQERVIKLGADFTAFVQEVVALNITSARTAQSIPDMQLVLPSDKVSVAIEALDRFGAKNEASLADIEIYQLLIALAGFRTKEALVEAIKQERIEEERRVAQRQLAEKVVADAREKERILSVQKEVAERQRARAKEQELVARAKQVFPRL